MLFFWYLTRLFWQRWLGLLMACMALLTIFEFLSRSQTQNYAEIFYKLPFSVHKMLPFITFISMLMVCWRLIQKNEWSSLSNIGRSPWQILFPPLISVMILGFLDMGIIVPLGQRFFNPFHNKNTPISLHASGWKKGNTASGYLFFQKNDNAQHVIEFSKNSVMLQHLVSEKMDIQDQKILCSDAWWMPAHQCPSHTKTHTIDLSQSIDLDQTNDHPLLLSLSQVRSALVKKDTPSLLLSSRWHYWWSHFFWSLTLVPLAPALLIGPGHRYAKMLWAGFGIVSCLILYLIKEWLYAISIPLAHSWPPLLLWIPCLLTGCLSWIIFFEKKEL